MKNAKYILMAIMILSTLSPLVATIKALPSAGSKFSTWDSATTDYVVTRSPIPPSSHEEVPTSYINDTLVLRDWIWNDLNLVNVTFNINNTGNSPITSVKFHVYETPEMGAYFHAITAYYFGPFTWFISKQEVDTKGWHRLIAFDAAPGVFIPVNQQQNFTITFGANASNVRSDFYYRFAVSKTDQAGSDDQYIYWALDTRNPEVHITAPENGTIRIGTLNGTRGCGHHYFNVTFTASDEAAGLLNWTVLITYNATGLPVNRNDNLTKGNFNPLGKLNDTIVLYYDDFDNGTYTVRATVFDRVGHSAYDQISFTYRVPQRPFWVTPGNGYAALHTSYNSTVGIVASSRITQANSGKELGTIVNASGYGAVWGSGVLVTITVRIVTYDLFAPVNYEVPVANATTISDGNFSTLFIFPKAPRGIYNVTAKSANGFTCATTFEVLPEVVYNPNDVIGPAHINVEATGFYRPNVDRNFFTVYILCNNKDSLIGVNSQVFSNWYIDQNGTLANKLSDDIGRYIENGLFWPFMQPGTYNVSLFINAAGSWWNLDQWVPLLNFEHANTITVDETLSLLISIKADTAYIRTATDTITATLNQLSPVITSINGTVVTLSTTMGTVQATLNQLSPVITRIDNNVVTLNTTVGQINTTMATIGPQLAAISPDIATIKTSVGTGLNGTVASIAGDVATIKTDAGEIKTQVPSLTTPIYIAVVFSIIAAIAAIACAFLVYRKIA
jgi:hypothetical protein